MEDSKRIITSNDKRQLWEMIHAIIDFPILSEKLTGRWKSPKDVTNDLMRAECKILWMREFIPEFLPLEQAIALAHAAYASISD